MNEELAETLAKLKDAVERLPAIEEEQRALHETLKFARANPATYRLQARVEELRKKDPKLAHASDDVLVAKIAESRDPDHIEAWRAYREEANKAAQTRPTQHQVSSARYEDSDSPAKQTLEAMVDAAHAANPQAGSRARVRNHLLNTNPKAQQLLIEHARHVAKAAEFPSDPDGEGKTPFPAVPGRAGQAPHPAVPGGKPFPSKPGRTQFGDELERHVDGMQKANPGMSRDLARRKVVATDRGGTLLLRHEAALRDTPDNVAS